MLNSLKLRWRWILLIIDSVLLGIALYLAFVARNSGQMPSQAEFIYLISNFLILYLLWLLFLFFLDFYEIYLLRKPLHFFYHFSLFFVLALISGATYFYFRNDPAINPKTILFLNILFFNLFLLGSRYFLFKLSQRVGFKEHVAVLASGLEIENFIAKPLGNYQVDIVLIIDNSSKELPHKLQEQGIIVASDLSALQKVVLLKDIQKIILGENKTSDLLSDLFARLPLNIRYVSFVSFFEELDKRVPVDFIDEAWLLENISRPESRLQSSIKRLLDVVCGLIGGLAALIILPFVALAIKLNSPGPAIYKQSRLGKNGRIFTLYKFRTMVSDAEKDGPKWALPKDNRVTAVGNFLRLTYLDEFLQFFNVLKGDISVVGPRPERPEFTEKLKQNIPFYEIRQVVKPGLTGWAQINYKASTSPDESKLKFEYDLYYIKNRSVVLDLGIIFKTVGPLFIKQS